MRTDKFGPPIPEKTIMSRLHNPPASEATGEAAQIFAQIRQAIGTVPNAYAGIGSNSPLALQTVLGLDAALKKSSLSAVEVELVKLAVSEANGCDYCLAAHTLFGKKAGLSDAAILAARHGNSQASKEDALTQLARTLVKSRGTVPAEIVTAVQQAGYSDQQIVDVLLAVTAVTFTNYFNRLNDTVLDLPAAA